MLWCVGVFGVLSNLLLGGWDLFGVVGVGLDGFVCFVVVG